MALIVKQQAANTLRAAINGQDITIVHSLPPAEIYVIPLNQTADVLQPAASGTSSPARRIWSSEE
jgi:hypothetical protein